MELLIKESGEMAQKMDLEYNNGKTAQGMKENGKMTKLMEKVN